jgi:hypothetical protein
MSQRIIYLCKKCGWNASITVFWPDIKPKRCGNKKCKTFFLKSPELLEVLDESKPLPKSEGEK